ncbi:MAG: diacylglycerol kinase family protein [Saprospiraceae bacterium]
MSKNTFQKRIKSFQYAFQGIADLFRSQPNARIHLTVLFCVLLAGIYFQLTPTEWALIIVCSGMVLAGEAANTAIEYLTDLVSPEYHPLAGKAKDVAAAAVLIMAISAVLVGLIIFLPKLISLFSS